MKTNYPEEAGIEADNLLTWIKIELGEKDEYDSGLVKMVLKDHFDESCPDDAKGILEILSKNKDRGIQKAAKALLRRY